MASATRCTASSWPTTRSWSLSSIASSLSRSPCIIFETGLPVARDTTSAISSAPTWVRSSFGFSSFEGAFSAFFSCASSWGMRPYWSSDTFCQSPFRSELFRPDLGAEQLRFLLLRRRLLGLFQLRFELGDAAVLELGHLLPVTLPLGDLHFELELLQFFFHVLGAGDMRLFRLPHFLQVGVFALELLDFGLDQRQALL